MVNESRDGTTKIILNDPTKPGMMKNLYIERKAVCAVNDWITKVKNKKFIVSFSGGKDSTLFI